MCINHCKWPRFYGTHSHFTSVPFLIAVLFANLLSPLVSLVLCFYSLHSASLKSVTLLGKYSTVPPSNSNSVVINFNQTSILGMDQSALGQEFTLQSRLQRGSKIITNPTLRREFWIILQIQRRRLSYHAALFLVY